MDETAIYELSKIIQASENIVFFGGAGVSTESNIPDFRSEKGIYNIKSKYNFPPETMLSHSFFINQTSLFYDFYKTSMIFPNAKPNLAHLTLAKLEQMGKLKAVITQNIEGLHQAAGSRGSDQSDPINKRPPEDIPAAFFLRAYSPEESRLLWGKPQARRLK